jgi:hypothetical protein
MMSRTGTGSDASGRRCAQTSSGRTAAPSSTLGHSNVTAPLIGSAALVPPLPEALPYLTKRVNEALTRLGAQGVSERRALEAELQNAKEELENIKTAIRRGVVTDTTREMLEEAERKVQTIRANMGLAAEPKIAVSVRTLPSLVENYLRNLRSVLYRDTDRARLMLSRLVGDIVLRPEEDGVVAEVRGNVGALLGVEFGSTNGAGRGI